MGKQQMQYTLLLYMQLEKKTMITILALWQLYYSGSLSLHVCTKSKYCYMIMHSCDPIDSIQCNTIEIITNGLLSAAIIELILMGDVGVLMVTPL